MSGFPPQTRLILLRRADESLDRHREGPDGMCLWCAREWRQRVPYPCEFVAIALGVRKMCLPPERTPEPRTELP